MLREAAAHIGDMNATTLSPAPAPIAEPRAAERELTHADRCDSCGARAFGIAEITRLTAVGATTSELMFCGHHFRKHRERLAATGAKLTDLTHLIHDDKDRKSVV